MNLSELAKEIHANAVEHGWWESERSFGEVIALCHSELSEALEEYRNGHGLAEVYYNGDKPEGVPVELADCIIRILDYCGYVNLECDDKGAQSRVISYYCKNLNDFGDVISAMHLQLSMSRDYTDYGNFYLIVCIHYILQYCEWAGIDIDAVVRLKIEYNKTRSYRHGNKVI